MSTKKEKKVGIPGRRLVLECPEGDRDFYTGELLNKGESQSESPQEADHKNLVSAFLSDVRRELGRAREKFPPPNMNHAAMHEEAGEVTKALLQERWNHVYQECVQTAAMALRVAIEGDESFDDHRRKARLNLAQDIFRPPSTPPLTPGAE